jgi:hypothetical protein
MTENVAPKPLELPKLPAQRQAYAAPQLKLYGSVRDLTMNGTGSALDSRGGPTIPSDPRIKQNVLRVGTHPLGIGLYLFEYTPEYQPRFGLGRHFGVMADQLQMVMPDAVITGEDGIRLVLAARAGIEDFAGRVVH